MTEKPLLPEGAEIDLFQVSEAVWAREEEHGYAGLTDAERVFLCVWSLEAEVNNGGFGQYFDNSAGDHAADTPQALRRLGADEMAGLVERALAPFGAAGPPAEREARWAALESLPESVREEWRELDGLFCSLVSPETELRAFVETHRRDFYAP